MFSHLRLTLPLFLTLTALQAGAQTMPTSVAYTSGVSHDKRHVTYTVQPDGTYVKDVELIRLIENEVGIRTEGQQVVPYSASLQRVEIVQARVITANGETIDVAPSAIIDQQPYLQQGAPAFSDIKGKAVIFPQVSKGARTVLHARITQVTPLLPGHFSAVEFASPHDVRRDVTYTVIAPADMPLRVSGDDLEVKKTVLPDGRVQWRAHTTNAVAVPPEPGSVAQRDYSQRFIATTLPSGAALAHAYLELVGDRRKPTAEVETLARSLIKDVKDPREQTRILYDWVRVNIRYVALALGRGGLQPRAVNEILSTAYGDCKDKAILLSAMLESIGIASTPVLIHSGNSFWMPELPTLQSFNHMITYIPSLDMYVDATERWAPFGVLPPEDSSKKVLHLVDGKWAETPYSASLAELRHTVTADVDGKVTGRLEFKGQGIQEIIMGRMFSPLESIPDSTLMPPLLQQMQIRGEGRLQRAATGSNKNFSTLVFDYFGSSALDFSTPGATKLPSSPFDLMPGLALIYQTPRKFPFSCPASVVREVHEFELPANVKVTRTFPALEKTVDSEHASFRYVAHTKQEGSKTIVTRELISQRRQAVCTSADQARWQPMIEAVQRNVRAQMIYE